MPLLFDCELVLCGNKPGFDEEDGILLSCPTAPYLSPDAEDGVGKRASPVSGAEVLVLAEAVAELLLVAA